MCTMPTLSTLSVFANKSFLNAYLVVVFRRNDQQTKRSLPSEWTQNPNVV